MNVIPLIGASLKSDDIIDFLEHWEAVVVYDFDRLHENTPDAYRVTVPTAGMELRFDANQILETLFLRIASTDDFASFDIANSDVAFWNSTDEARQFAVSRNLTATEGSALFLGIKRDWIKLNLWEYTSHYEFVGGKLNLVTLALQMLSQWREETHLTKRWTRSRRSRRS